MRGFTKGPWVIIPSGDEWGRGRVGTIEPRPDTMVETNYWTVAECNNRRDECVANARLIAAAPDLFRELRLVLDYEEQSQFEQWMRRASPHGDCDSVQAQWLESGEYEDFCDLWSGPIAAIDKALTPQS